MTSIAISKKYAGNLPAWQHKANANYFDRMWDILKVGGIYTWIDQGRMFVKLAAYHQWEEVL